MEETKEKKIGRIGLIGFIISSCVGAGAFELTQQIAAVAAPGSAIIAWVILGLGFLLFALCLGYLSRKKPDIVGIFGYASKLAGPLCGFMSGWGYWLSAWLGNVAFATMMMSTIGYFIPEFASGNSILSVAVASAIMWLMTYFVSRGIESAAVLNSIVMFCKILMLVIFIIACLFFFNAGIFTADFWGNVQQNLTMSASSASQTAQAGHVANAVQNADSLGTIFEQVNRSILVMMWAFIGIEGATVMSNRARRKSDVSRASVIGVITLIVLYIGVSVLPYGYMPYTEIATLGSPAVSYIFESMAPGFGGAFVSVGIMIAIGGAWLSFTILPIETTLEMSKVGLLPSSWSKVNKYGTPISALIVTSTCAQFFLITLLFTDDAYNFATSMCTAAIVVTWSLAVAYQIEVALENKDRLWCVAGVVSLLILIVGFSVFGWDLFLLTLIGYIPGFFFYNKARKEKGLSTSVKEKVIMVIISGVGVATLIMVSLGDITI